MCVLDKTEIVKTGPFNSSPNQITCTSVQSSHVWSKIYNVRSLNRKKHTILQCTCDQQRLRHAVSASTHWIKQASWIARSPKKVHTVRSAKGLIRMCCCSRTVYPALDSPVIKGKYYQRILLSECAVGRLTRVFACRKRRFVKPRDCRWYIRLAKTLIRLLMCRLRVCRLIHLFVQVLLKVLPCTDQCVICLCKP